MSADVRVADPPARISRRVWIFVAGQGISLFGTEIGTLALPIVAVLVLGLGPAELSLLTAASFLPALFAPLFAGPLADRVERVRLLLLCDIGRAGVIALMVTAYVADALTLPVLVALLLSRAVLANIFDAAYFSVLPDLMDKRQLVVVNGRLSAVHNTALVAGPAVGGTLAALWGFYTLLLDAVSYLFSVLTLSAVRSQVHQDKTTTEPVRFWSSVGAGFSTLWQLQPVRLLAFTSAALNLFLAGQEALLVLFVLRVLDLSAGVLGVCLAAGAVGGLLMGLVVERAMDAFGNRVLLIASSVAVTSSCLAIALTPEAIAAPYLAVVLFVQSAMMVWYSIVNASLRQLLVPRELRGRVFASMRVLSRGVIPLGAVLAGVVAATTSIRTALFIDGVGLALVVVWIVTQKNLVPRTMQDVDVP